VVQPWQMTTVWACEKTVVMVKQPGHLTSMKKERGAGTRVYISSAPSTDRRVCWCISAYLELVLAGLGNRAGVQQINGENLVEKSSVSITPCYHRFSLLPVDVPPSPHIPPYPAAIWVVGRLRCSAPK
jgi:hypothetical protein